MKKGKGRSQERPEPEDASFAEILSRFEAEQSASRQGSARAAPASRGYSRASARGASNARRGTVVGVSGDYVLVDFGAKAEGVISAADLRDSAGKLVVRPGDSFEVAITGRNAEGFVTLSRLTGPRPRDWQSLQEAFEKQQTIAGRITGLTRGGLTVDVGARAFLPASRSGARDAAEMEKLVEQEIRCRIIQFDLDDGNVVVDRRGVLEEEARIAQEAVMATLAEGAVVRGTVRSLTDFGAFIDLGGVDGLLHVGDLSWSRVKDPRSELLVGDTLDLKILKVDREAGKVSLGLKQMYPDPWDTAAVELKPGDRLRGTVTKLTDFGAFVEVRPGVEGMVHVSEMSWTRRVRKPSDLLRKGEDIEAVVLKMDGPARRLSLGLKQVLGNPWDTVAQRYPPGAHVEGIVRRLAKFGAFVEVEDGIEGLIHVSDLSAERRIEHPGDVVKIGATVKAVVLEADSERRRLKLGMKQLEATSLDDYLREHQPGDRVMGRVVRVEDSSATVQLGEGVEGICLLGASPAGAAGPAPAAPESRGALGAALAAAWKGPLPAAAPAAPAAPASPPAEPLREGQLRAFVIRRLDPATKRIELATA